MGWRERARANREAHAREKAAHPTRTAIVAAASAFVAGLIFIRNDPGLLAICVASSSFVAWQGIKRGRRLRDAEQKPS